MDLHLKDKVILVTGGARGIGEAVVRGLKHEDAIPVYIDKDEKLGARLFDELGRKGHFFSADVTDANACSKCVDEVVKKFGSIDGLVNNAGINDGVGLQSGTPERFVRSMNNNAGHYYYFAHFSTPHLKKSRGAIVNISSKTAVTGQGNTSGYVAAKGAILALTREWAVELAADGIRVNAVVPAEVWTPLYESWLNTQSNPKEKLKTITSKIPLENRMTKAEEIADMVLFLLSDRASHVTGQWIHVDGGYVHLDRAMSQ